MNLAFDWLQIDTDGFWLAGELIAGLEPVATLSRTLTPAQLEARFAFREEVHRRFSAEQPLGNVFRWSALGLSLRPHIKAAYQDAVTAAEATFDRTEFEQIVNDRLGPATISSYTAGGVRRGRVARLSPLAYVTAPATVAPNAGVFVRPCSCFAAG